MNKKPLLDEGVCVHSVRLTPPVDRFHFIKVLAAPKLISEVDPGYGTRTRTSIVLSLKYDKSVFLLKRDEEDK